MLLAELAPCTQRRNTTVGSFKKLLGCNSEAKSSHKGQIRNIKPLTPFVQTEDAAAWQQISLANKGVSGE